MKWLIVSSNFFRYGLTGIITIRCVGYVLSTDEMVLVHVCMFGIYVSNIARHVPQVDKPNFSGSLERKVVTTQNNKSFREISSFPFVFYCDLSTLSISYHY